MPDYVVVSGEDCSGMRTLLTEHDLAERISSAMGRARGVYDMDVVEHAVRDAFSFVEINFPGGIVDARALNCRVAKVLEKEFDRQDIAMVFIEKFKYYEQTQRGVLI